jgi:capsular exopolysaccharide synthesis family protein
MSKFFKALQQAEVDRGLGDRSGQDGPRLSAETGAKAAPPPPPPGPETEVATAAPDGIDEHLVSLLAPASFEAEQYRGLRYVVEQAHRSANLSVVAVSAPSAGDGKTLTAINLAGALAQARGTRVLLVDADLRRPAVARRLGIAAVEGRGLKDAILSRTLTLGDVAQRYSSFNLWVLPAGRASSVPYELLKSPRLAELFDESRRTFSYIIVDTPPLVPASDCQIIGTSVDGFIVVVAAHKTPRRLVEEALNTIGPAKIAALVFNNDDGTVARHDYAADRRSENGHDARRWIDRMKNPWAAGRP